VAARGNQGRIEGLEMHKGPHDGAKYHTMGIGPPQWCKGSYDGA